VTLKVAPWLVLIPQCLCNWAKDNLKECWRGPELHFSPCEFENRRTLPIIVERAIAKLVLEGSSLCELQIEAPTDLGNVGKSIRYSGITLKFGYTSHFFQGCVVYIGAPDLIFIIITIVMGLMATSFWIVIMNKAIGEVVLVVTTSQKHCSRWLWNTTEGNNSMSYCSNCQFT
jgi:hypothetical protein